MTKIDVDGVTRIVISQISKVGNVAASRRILIESNESGMIMLNLSMSPFDGVDSSLKIEEKSEDELIKIYDEETYEERYKIFEKII